MNADSLLPLELDYFNGIGSQESVARPVFMANACHVCKDLHQKSEGKCRSVQLLSCSGCRLIPYCGVEHQKTHWPEHKELCKAVAQILKKEKKIGLFHGLHHLPLDRERWKMIRYTYMIQVEESLKRSMYPYEREMFLYPRVCITCLCDDGTKLKDCTQCHSMFYCCSEHIPEQHSEYCKDLQLLFELNLSQSKNGSLICQLPHTLINTYEPLPSSLKEFLVTRMLGPIQAMSMGKAAFATLTETASFPLTILWSLQEAAKKLSHLPKIETRKSLLIHIVGAELPFECDNLAKWDVFLLNTLPELQTLYIVFIGPELTNVPTGKWKQDLRCPYCIRKNKQFICDFQPNTLYHDYVKRPEYTKPDIIVAFNCGLYRETGFQGTDSWAKTIPYLLHVDVPFVLTAYTAREAPMDLQRLQEVLKTNIEVVICPKKNPYSSLRPYRNFVSEEETPLIFKNHYITVVCQMVNKFTNKKT